MGLYSYLPKSQWCNGLNHKRDGEPQRYPRICIRRKIRQHTKEESYLRSAKCKPDILVPSFIHGNKRRIQINIFILDTFIITVINYRVSSHQLLIMSGLDAELAPKFAPFLGMVSDSPILKPGMIPQCWQSRLYPGIAAAMIFGCNYFHLPLHDSTYWVIIGIGAAYRTAKSGISIIGVSTFQPDIVLRVS